MLLINKLIALIAVNIVYFNKKRKRKNVVILNNFFNTLFREFYLTLPSNSNSENEMMSSMAMLHEFLHQWFGNMVTTPWWDHAWLNEGICNYLNYYIMDTVRLKLRVSRSIKNASTMNFSLLIYLFISFYFIPCYRSNPIGICTKSSWKTFSSTRYLGTSLTTRNR